jgi:hypothetical protein
MTAGLSSKLLKVKALAEAGSGGEREAACAVLNRLMLKHGLPDGGLSTEPKKQYRFSYENKYEKRILLQIYAKVTQQNRIRYRYPNNRSKQILLTLTPGQYREMKKLYSVYGKAFKKEMQRVVSGLIEAFIYKHDLWSGVETDGEIQPIPALERRLLRDLYHNLEDVENPALKITEAV